MSLYIILSIWMLSSQVLAENESRICLVKDLLQNYTTFLDQVKATKEDPELQITYDKGLNELRTSIGHCDVVKLVEPVELEKLYAIFKETLDVKYNPRVFECLEGIVQHLTEEIKGSALNYIKHAALYGLEMAVLGSETPLEFPEESIHLAFMLQNCGNKTATTTTTTTTTTTEAPTTTEKPSGGGGAGAFFWHMFG